MKPVWMVATIKYCRRDDGYTETIEEPVFYTDLYWETPAEFCAHTIAATRNIAATWDVVEVLLYIDRLDYIANLGALNVTQEVKDAYDKLYVVRRPEFLSLMGG